MNIYKSFVKFPLEYCMDNCAECSCIAHVSFGIRVEVESDVWLVACSSEVKTKIPTEYYRQKVLKSLSKSADPFTVYTTYVLHTKCKKLIIDCNRSILWYMYSRRSWISSGRLNVPTWPSIIHPSYLLISSMGCHYKQLTLFEKYGLHV